MSVDEDVANNVANMTLLSETANKEFRDQPPWKYAPTAIQDPIRLQSHFIPANYATSFTSGKAIFRKTDLAKLLSDRLKEIKKEARALLLA